MIEEDRFNCPVCDSSLTAEVDSWLGADGAEYWTMECTRCQYRWDGVDEETQRNVFVFPPDTFDREGESDEWSDDDETLRLD